MVNKKKIKNTIGDLETNFWPESEMEHYQKQMEKNCEDVEKIMKKAIENGFKFPFYTVELRKFCLFFGDLRWVDSVIFSEDFAVAFFGGEKRMKGKWFVCYEWQQHLQKMAIIPIEERIKYLLSFL